MTQAQLDALEAERRARCKPLLDDARTFVLSIGNNLTVDNRAEVVNKIATLSENDCPWSANFILDQYVKESVAAELPKAKQPVAPVVVKPTEAPVQARAVPTLKAIPKAVAPLSEPPRRALGRVSVSMEYEAKRVQAATGIPYLVVEAWWIAENGRVWPPAHNNPGNIESAGYGPAGYDLGADLASEHSAVRTYATIDAGVDAFIDLAAGRKYALDRRTYRRIIDAARSGFVPKIITAIGESPWAESHYGNPPGSHILTIYWSLGGSIFAFPF